MSAITFAYLSLDMVDQRRVALAAVKINSSYSWSVWACNQRIVIGIEKL